MDGWMDNGSQMNVWMMYRLIDEWMVLIYNGLMNQQMMDVYKT